MLALYRLDCIVRDVPAEVLENEITRMVVHGKLVEPAVCLSDS